MLTEGPSMNYHTVLSQVVSRYANFVLVFLPYLFGYHMGKVYPQKWRSYLTVAGLVGVCCLVFWSSYGTHFENSDPIYGGGEQVQDFVPTEAQRNEYGLEELLTFEIAALFGVAKRNQKKIEQTS